MNRMRRTVLENRPARITGIFADASAVYLTEIIWRTYGWEVSFAGQVPVGIQEVMRDEAVMEQVKVCCMREGLSCNPVALCLLDEQVSYCVKVLPKMRRTELLEAIHWEIAAEMPFGDEETLEAFLPMEDGTGNVLLAAIEKRNADVLWRLYQENGLALQMLTSMPARMESLEWQAEGLCWRDEQVVLGTRAASTVWTAAQYTSLYAALTLTVPDFTVNFLPQAKRRGQWAWKRLLGGAFLLLFFLWNSVFLYQTWILHGLEQREAAQESQLVLLHAEQKYMQESQAKEAAIERKNACLMTLSKERKSGYSLLVYLGTKTVDGVWIEKMVLQDHMQQAVLQGRAVSYAALADFLQMLEQEKDFFTAKPVLTSSGQTKDGTEEIEFSLELRL